MTANIQWGLAWSVRVVALPQGASAMTVPDQQSLKLTEASAGGGGIVPVVIAGSTPTSGEISTACTTLGTNAAACINQAANLAQIQGWNTGGG